MKLFFHNVWVGLFLALLFVNSASADTLDSNCVGYPVGDVDRNYKVDFNDFALLASQWLDQPYEPSADIEPVGGDNIVDFKDLWAMCECWLAECDALPPDPVTVAPPLNQSGVTTLGEASQFLYTSTEPIQTGLSPNVIERKRAAVLRGQVYSSNDDPLSGVNIVVLNHPEYGQTYSRDDGMFDLAVNGGEVLTLRYTKDGYFPVERRVEVPWQDYVPTTEIMMCTRDLQVTSIDLSEPDPFKIVQGNPVTDQDGTRQSTVLIPQGTSAEVVLPDGNTLPISELNIRATEYTSGLEGPDRMPAELPPTIAYTYCVELSVDEMEELEATDVQFNQPVYHYVDNYLGIPVGMAVPSGYYDQERGLWVPSKNGCVIKILDIMEGLALLDTTGDDMVDNGVALGISEAEREELAALYSVGQSLWRVPVDHFSAWDFNWTYKFPSGSIYPGPPEPFGLDELKSDNPCFDSGSIIECESQILGERIGITGTALSLNYTSDRVPGREAARMLVIPISGPNIPAELEYIELKITVAGREFTYRVDSPAPDMEYTFVWDGNDVYGRTVERGSQPVNIVIGYAYEAEYMAPTVDPGFGVPGGIPTGVTTRENAILWLVQNTVIKLWDARDNGLGGWTLSNHHAYDPLGYVLYRGDGRRQSIQSVGKVINTIAGDGHQAHISPIDDGLKATESAVQNPLHVLVNPDGTFYTTDTWGFGFDNVAGRVRYIDANGIITSVAGVWDSDPNANNMADGIPATQAYIAPESLALGPDGLLYISSQYRIRRIEPDGTIETIAGNYPWTWSGLQEGVPATDVDLDPRGIAFGPDGGLYIADYGTNTIRRVDPNGIITTVAGNGGMCWSGLGCGDDVNATDIALYYPEYVAVAPDGSIYFTEQSTALRKVSPDGIITTVLRNFSAERNWDEGVSVDSALAGDIRGICFGPDGILYLITEGDRFSSGSSHTFVRRIDGRGIVNTIAGTEPDYTYGGDGGPPLQANLYKAEDLDIGPDGSIYIADTANNRVRKISDGLPGTEIDAYMIASDNGDLVYEFDGSGRHLTTRNSLTGSVLYEFFYDPNNGLEMIVDGNDNVTTIDRDTNGAPIAIIAPFGQSTSLTVDSNGYLSNIINPAGENYNFSYSETGLLTQMTDARGGIRLYDYDDQGYLISNRDPDDNLHTLSREEFSGGHTVTRTSAMGATTTYRSEKLSTGQLQRLNTFPDGTQSRTLTGTDQSLTVETADGMTTRYLKGPDPRFGMQSPIIKELTVNTPNGPNSVTTANRTVGLNDPNDPLGIQYILDKRSINGRNFSSYYSGSNRIWTQTTPENRQSTRKIDNHGRLVYSQVGTLNSINYSYDNYGRLMSFSTGSGLDQRITTITYDANGYVEEGTNPLENSISYYYDAVGRVTRQVLLDGNEAVFGHNENGDVNSIKPPGRPVHKFTYTGSSLLSEYIPPDVVSGDDTTYYTYNQDNQLLQIIRPDGKIIGFVYDDAGRLSEVNVPDGNIAYTYNPTTGQVENIAKASGEFLSFSYNGKLLTEENWSGTITGSVQYSYNNNYRIASESVNEENLFSFLYDDDSLLTTAGDISLTRNTENGFITATQIGNITDQWTYNSFGEVESYIASYSGLPFYSIQYVRDKLGRITQKTETIESLTTIYDYSYNASGHLVEVKENSNPVSTYTYGDNSNRASYNTISATYDNQDRLLTYGDISYTYSNNGELLTATSTGQTTTYQYDVLGNLVSVELPDGTLIAYVIDGCNRIVGKKIDGVLIKGFLYRDKLNPIAELDAVGNVVSRFVYGSRINVPDYIIRDNISYRVVCDHLGSPRLIVNAQTGTVAQRMDFDEFGRVLTDTNPGFQPFGFAGGIYDSNTGLVRFGARDYDPHIGRWTAKDPLRFAAGQFNLYTYIGNDPINSIDLTGWGGLTDFAASNGVSLVFHPSWNELSYKEKITMLEYTIMQLELEHKLEQAGLITNHGLPNIPLSSLPGFNYQFNSKPSSSGLIPSELLTYSGSGGGMISVSPFNTNLQDLFPKPSLDETISALEETISSLEVEGLLYQNSCGYTPDEYAPEGPTLLP